MSICRACATLVQHINTIARALVLAESLSAYWANFTDEARTRTRRQSCQRIGVERRREALLRKTRESDRSLQSNTGLPERPVWSIRRVRPKESLQRTRILADLRAFTRDEFPANHARFSYEGCGQCEDAIGWMFHSKFDAFMKRFLPTK